METKTDSKGSVYIEVSNLRITYVEQKNRSSLKDWPNSDVLRIQAYKGDGKKLFQGAEYPVKDEKDIYSLLQALSILMKEK